MTPKAKAEAAEEAATRVMLALQELSSHGRQPTFIDHVIDVAAVSVDGAAYNVLNATGLIEPIRISDLAQYLLLDVSTVSRHIRSLEGKGYIARSIDESDRRASILTLTPLGTSVRETVQVTSRAITLEILNGWRVEELDQLARSLDGVVIALRKYLAGLGSVISS